MMMLTTILNGALGLAATITMCYITVDIDRQILNGDPNYPYVQIFAEALDTVGGAVTLAAGTIVICLSKFANAPLWYKTYNADPVKAWRSMRLPRPLAKIGPSLVMGKSFRAQSTARQLR
jgi:hypothetical protein